MAPSVKILSSEQRLQGGIHFPAWENSVPVYKRLDGKVAIVTGGARGIGEAIARLFAEHGARVVVADIDDSAGELLAATFPHSLVFVHCDITQEPDVEHLVSSTLAKHGRIDIFVNNAGVLGTQSKARRSIAVLDTNDFENVMQVNVKGVALGMKHAARAMLPRRSGCIISMASVAGVAGGLGPHAYTASKHAVIGLTQSAACELGGYGIRVNCISPFGVATPMLIEAWRDEIVTGQGEVEKMEEAVRGWASLKGVTLTVKDVAEAAIYLASDESRYISGHNLLVDGGFTTSRNSIGLY